MNACQQRHTTQVAVLNFEFEGDPRLLEVHVFRGEGVIGEHTESEEMLPKCTTISS
jgi:hypothetical protein